MKHFVKILWLFSICAVSVFAQKSEEAGTVQFVEVPREIVLQAIAVQPDCPIKFENVLYLAGVHGGSSNRYQLRNTGTKPVRGFTVASSNGAMHSYGGEQGFVLAPGELLPKPVVCKDCAQSELIPLSDQLREKLNLKGSMQSVVVLMVVSVEFTDGTKYEDEKAYKAMQAFIDELADAMYEKKRAVKRP